MSVAGTLIQVVSQRAPRAVRSAGAVLALAVPLAVLAFLLIHPRYDHALPTNLSYLYLVAFIALLGFAISVGITGIINRIESSYTEAIVALIAEVETRDRYTKGHSARVSQMAVLIGQTMRLPRAALRSLARAGFLHDVGKFAVPEAILGKPGRLTPEEYAIVRQYPMRGLEVIGRVASLRKELPGVLHHHEWYDGSGYPHGLRGEEIPLAARILAVADVYDALTSERPYRGALSEDEAVAHLHRLAGIQFDATLVEAFARIEPAWRERRRRAGP